MTGDKDGSVSDGEDEGFNVALLLEEEVGTIVVDDIGDLVGGRGWFDGVGFWEGRSEILGFSVGALVRRHLSLGIEKSPMLQHCSSDEKISSQ